MKEIRSISGDWLRLTAKHSYPDTSKPHLQARRLARALNISVSSCRRYIDEQLRVPEHVERRFIELFGEPAEDGWRTVVQTRPGRKVVKNPKPKKTVSENRSKEYKYNWRMNAQRYARQLAEGALKHRLGEFLQHPVTKGEMVALEKGLDLEEALDKYPEGFYKLDTPEDWVVQCTLCEGLGSVNDLIFEITGLVFRATCGEKTYRLKNK
jgi:hypothetical protein